MASIVVDKTELGNLKKKYLTVNFDTIEKKIFNKCEYYSKKNYNSLEANFGFVNGRKHEFIEGIKDFITLIDFDYIKKENEPTKEEPEKPEEELSPQETKIILKEIFKDIKTTLRKYVKLKEEYYDVVAVWVIGTYIMDSFTTYPYLFFNAQKGSGKTRMLKLLETITSNGVLLTSMREAVLFRLADQNYSLMIDELEGLDRKENAPLRELLNACYKKGTQVFRMKKKGDEWVFDNFKPFTAIAIANIGGVDDVLGDRVLTLKLDKTAKSNFALLQEDFDEFGLIEKIRNNFKCIKLPLCRLCSKKYNRKSWNNYVINRRNKLTTTTTTLNTLTQLTTPSQRESTQEVGVGGVYGEIIDSKITGRHLELIFPLLTISLMLEGDIFNKILEFGKEISKEKKEDDITESLDVSLQDFISKMSVELDYKRYRLIHQITDKFRFFLGIRDRFEQQEINPRWMSRALKRLGLVVDSRRVSSGREVTLNIPKATKAMEEIS